MILLFGGGGQLGKEMVRTAHEQGVALTATSRVEADISDSGAVARVMASIRPGLVVNAAAYTKVDQAEVEPAEAMLANERGPAILSGACATAGVPLVHLSTDYVFDGTKLGPYRETDPVAPLGVYGRTKAAGEAGIRSRHERHLILRTSWVYGEFGANFCKTMLRLAGERDELRVVSDQRGCPTSTRDLALAICQIAPRLIARENIWGTYHLAGAGVTTWHGFASRIVDAQARSTGRRPKVIPIATADYRTRARRPLNSELDSSRFADTFNFRAAPWIESVDRTVACLLAPERGTHDA